VTGSRRLSQAISEGDGISILASVGDAVAARAAEEQGADGVALLPGGPAVALDTDLPILFRGPIEDAAASDADACLLDVETVGDDKDDLVRFAAEARALGLELVVSVTDDDQLQIVLDLLDPEVLLLSPKGADNDEEALEHVLALLPDIPAGKLAIAELNVSGRAQLHALERAGFDAVLVGPGDFAGLVVGAPHTV
jgi:indole-3-glycerol phosphate synthase